MAMHLCRNIGRYANKFSLPAKVSCSERFSIGARSYSSSPLSQIKGHPSAATAFTAFRSTVKLSANLFLAWWTYNFLADDLRQTYANWKAEKKAQAMVKELESKKHESTEAYLVALEREFNALKAKLSKREFNDLEFELFDRPTDALKMDYLKRKADVLQLSMTKRELGALKQMVLSWDEDEDEDD